MKLHRNLFAITVLSVAAAFGVVEAGAQSPQAAINPVETSSSPPTLNGSSSRSEALDLNRIGVQTAQPLPLPLSDAIRRALEANNTIEISRGDVRLQETRVRGLLGIYDPVFTATPNFTRNSTTHDPATGSSATKDFRANSSIAQFIQPGGGNYQVFFNNARTENAFAQ